MSEHTWGYRSGPIMVQAARRAVTFVFNSKRSCGCSCRYGTALVLAPAPVILIGNAG